MSQRKEARLFTSIWDDEAFRALEPEPQRMYMFLLSQKDLNYCGVIALRERRWARNAKGLTVDQVMDDLAALARPQQTGSPLAEGFQKPFVVIDEETGELLVRSLVRNDRIWMQPNLIKAAREAANLIQSPLIKHELLEELRRLPLEESKSALVRSLVGAFITDLEKQLANPSGKGSMEPFREPFAGVRGTSTTCTTDPPSPGSPSPGPQRAPRASARDTRDTREAPDDVPPGDAQAPGSLQPEDAVERICNYLADRIAARGEIGRPQITPSWREAAEALLREWSEADIRAVIDYSQTDDLWHRHILSMPNLKARFERLKVQSKPRASSQRPTNRHTEPGAGDDLADVF